jgi:GT2 family glycosyltransferase
LHTAGKLLLCKRAIIIHKENSFAKISECSVWRRFFFYRNKVILIKRFFKNNILAYFNVTYRAVKASLSLLLKYRSFNSFLIPAKGLMSGFAFNMKFVKENQLNESHGKP